MKTTGIVLKSVMLVGAFAILFAFDLPAGWFKAGNKPGSYDMGIAPGAGQDGNNAATIKSIENQNSGFGTLMQQCKPGKYLGKRVKMSAFVKSENVAAWAALWMRVDQADSKQSLAFDNMHNRPIKGTTDWTKYEIELDVPPNASLIAYGAMLSGTGQIWFDKVTFEITGEYKPQTDGAEKKRATQEEPTNLDFEK